MKRSKTLRLALLAASPVVLTACGPEYIDPPPQPGTLEYASVEACYAADDMSDAQCDQAFAQARGLAPGYASEEECERLYGDEACEDFDGYKYRFIPKTKAFAAPYGFGTSKVSPYGSIRPIYGQSLQGFDAKGRRVVQVDPPRQVVPRASRGGFGSSGSSRGGGWGG